MKPSLHCIVAPDEPADRAPLLAPEAPPPLPRLPAGRGFPEHLGDDLLLALSRAAVAEQPSLLRPLEVPRWTYSDLDRIAFQAIRLGRREGRLPGLNPAQEDVLVIAATRRLAYLLAGAEARRFLGAPSNPP